MKNIKTIFSILLLLPLLTGCGVLPIKDDGEVEHYVRKSTLKTESPSTYEDVIRQLGEPNWIEKRGGSTYFIYQSKGRELGVIFFVYVPVFAVADTDVFCLFLEFDETNNLVGYKSHGPLPDHIYDGCIDYFNLPTHAPYTPRPLVKGAVRGDAVKQLKLYWLSPTGPKNTILLCRSADQGHPAAQSRLGFLYGSGAEGLPKDMAKALMWYRLSAYNGSWDADSEAEKIQKTLSADQYARSRELYKDWQPGLCELDLMEAFSGENE